MDNDDLVTSALFAELTGLDRRTSTRVLSRRAKAHKTGCGREVVFKKEDVLRIAQVYIDAMKPKLDTDIDRAGLKEKYSLYNVDIVKLLTREDFPRPYRIFIDTEGGRGKAQQLWDKRELDAVDVDELLGKTEDDIFDKHPPFVYSGKQVEYIKFFVNMSFLHKQVMELVNEED